MHSGSSTVSRLIDVLLVIAAGVASAIVYGDRQGCSAAGTPASAIVIAVACSAGAGGCAALAESQLVKPPVVQAVLVAVVTFIAALIVGVVLGTFAIGSCT